MVGGSVRGKTAYCPQGTQSHCKGEAPAITEQYTDALTDRSKMLLCLYLFNWWLWGLGDLDRLEILNAKIELVEVLSEVITVVAV